MTPLSAFLHRVPLADHCMMTAATLATLEHLCLELQPRLIVEVGTFLGRGSTRVFGRAAGPQGTVIAVDTCAVNMARREGITRPESHQHLLLSNLATDPDTQNVHLLCASSLEASKMFQGPADLIFIDAGHAEFQVLADLDAWLPHLRPGGVICGDDYSENFPGVIRAVRARLPGHTHEGRIWWALRP